MNKLHVNFTSQAMADSFKSGLIRCHKSSGQTGMIVEIISLHNLSIDGGQFYTNGETWQVMEASQARILADNPHFTGTPEFTGKSFPADKYCHAYLEFQDSGTGYQCVYGLFSDDTWSVTAN